MYYPSLLLPDELSGHGDILAITASPSNSDVADQLIITNGLLGTTNALLILFMIFGVMTFIFRLIGDNIFHQL